MPSRHLRIIGKSATSESILQTAVEGWRQVERERTRVTNRVLPSGIGVSAQAQVVSCSF